MARMQVPLTQEQKAEAAARPDRMAIGGKGGFQVDKEEFTISKEQALFVAPSGTRIPLPEPDLPTVVLNAVAAIQVCHVPWGQLWIMQAA